MVIQNKIVLKRQFHFVTLCVVCNLPLNVGKKRKNAALNLFLHPHTDGDSQSCLKGEAVVCTCLNGPSVTSGEPQVSGSWSLMSCHWDNSSGQTERRGLLNQSTHKDQL